MQVYRSYHPKVAVIFWEFWAFFGDTKSLGIMNARKWQLQMVSTCGVLVVVTEALDSAVSFFFRWFS